MRYKRSPKQYFLRSSGLFLNSAKKLHSGREWHEYQISALVERGRGQFLECVCTQHLPLYSDFRAISANGGGGEINFQDVCATQILSFYPYLCAKHLGGILRWTVVGLLSLALSGPEWGEGTTSRMCVQSNICDSILICVPKIWGLLSWTVVCQHIAVLYFSVTWIWKYT